MYLEEEIVGDPLWRQNYSSSKEHASRVLDVLNDQSSRGQNLKLPEAEARLQFLHLVVTSLQATRQDKPGGVISARVLFDGSNGTPVNRRIRLPDKDRAPVASDPKRFMRGKARRNEQTFSLTADVAEALWQVPVDRRDRHLLGCQVEVGGDVFTNTVGTIGVASASYFWSRVAASVGRVTQYIARRSATAWHQLVADDFHLEAGERHCRAALITFFVLCATAGIRLSWTLLLGQVSSFASILPARDIRTKSAVDHQLDPEDRRFYFSQRQHLRRRTRQGDVRGGGARIRAPLPRTTLPIYVTPSLQLGEVGTGLREVFPVSPCSTALSSPDIIHALWKCIRGRRLRELTRKPARKGPGLGGWVPVTKSEGKLDPWLSPWFSYELIRTDWPWIFEKGDKPSLIISTLEALAVLISLKLFFGDEPKRERTKVQVVPTWTDNRGNGSALNKLMSTKFPSSAVVMELSWYPKRMSAKASVEWAPRTARGRCLGKWYHVQLRPFSENHCGRKSVNGRSSPRRSAWEGRWKKIQERQEQEEYQHTEEGNSGDASRRTRCV